MTIFNQNTILTFLVTEDETQIGLPMFQKNNKIYIRRPQMTKLYTTDLYK